MAVNPSPFGPKPQFELAAGAPNLGGQLFFYVGGSVNTKQNTYTDSTGGSANTNPIVLNALGQPANEIWFTAGQAYKVVYAPAGDTDPPSSPIWSVDNLRGINDSSITVDQWVASGITPTYVNATQFTMPGDQTSNFAVGRRVKCAVTAGTVYGRISVSAYAALTTVTLVLDGVGALDAGLSAVSYGLLTPGNHSFPPTLIQAGSNITVTYDSAGRPVIAASSASPPQIQPISASVGSNALTISSSALSLDFRSTTLGSGTVTTVSGTPANLVVPSGATLGTSNGVAARIWIAELNNAGTLEHAVMNTQLGGGQIAAVNESTLISTTAISAASNSAGVWYSTTARTNVAFRLIGYVECTEAAAGTWATAPALIQGMGPGVKKPGEVVQVVFNQTGAVATGNTATPNDDTIPQNTEGDQYISQTITPTSVINTLETESVWVGTNTGGGAFVVALHVDAVANAQAVTIGDMSAATRPSLAYLKFREQALTVSATTKKIRVGASGGPTSTFNGSAGARLYGGVITSYLSIEEIMA